MLRLAREALELSLFVAAIAPFAVRVREKARRSKHKNGLSLSLAAITPFPARAREKSRRSKRGAINETG
jgi:hypothetical protein